MQQEALYLLRCGLYCMSCELPDSNTGTACARLLNGMACLRPASVPDGLEAQQVLREVAIMMMV